MKLSAILFSLSVFLIAGCSAGSDRPTGNEPQKAAETAPAQKRPPGSRVPVMVELFTSEGCPNCPPADRQLMALETEQPYQEADIITLGFHVDYFNDRGWKDEFSLPVFTQRQNLYASRMKLDTVYTPQMIVDGTKEFVGSDMEKARDAILQAAAHQKGDVDFRINDVNGEVRASNLGVHGPAAAILAMVEDGHETKVGAGSNGGMTLRHVSVVRKVLLIGQLPVLQTSFNSAFALPVSPTGKNANVRYIVYFQEDTTGRIIAVGRAKVVT